MVYMHFDKIEVKFPHSTIHLSACEGNFYGYRKHVFDIFQKNLIW